MTENGDQPILVGDRYELGGLLGRGGMADVRVGRDLRLGRTVAVKQLRADLSADETFQARFQREAQSSAALNHPSIVAVYDTGASTDMHGNHIPYIVMEYVEGQTLRDLMRGTEGGRKILPERAMSITADILSALDYSHRSGIIHRDIKPANVMLTPSGQVKVMDFGIARAISDASSAMTATAAVIGTAQYLSPEQARGETVDARSDIYSTGCLLYELLTGRPPFVGDSPVSVAYQHVREEARPPSQLNPDVSAAIDHVVAKSLAKKVDDRYSSAAEMRKDLERAMAGQQVEAPAAATAVVAGATAVAPAVAAPVAGGARRAEPEDEERRNPAIWWAVGVLILAILGAIGFALSQGGPDDPPVVTQVAVTDVSGMEIDAAQRALINQGFEVGSVTEKTSAEIKKGRVIETDPAAGTKVDEGSTIDLVISAGPEQVTIPPLNGFSYEQAKDLLEGDRYKLRVSKEEQDSSLPKDEVINSDPPPGTSVNVGSKITLKVSKGQVSVPSVIGDDEDAAKAELEDLGLEVTINDDPESLAPAGEVTAQSIAEGQKVPPGTTITLTVSRAPEIPDEEESPGP